MAPIPVLHPFLPPATHPRAPIASALAAEATP